jgi:hypothetical protein
MDINAAFSSKYLKASDLQGRDVTVKMGRVEQEKVGDDMKLVIYFQGKERGMILNRTNANAIADAYGGETEDWYGKAITLFEQMVDFQGKRVPGLRIRAPRQAPRPAPQRQMAEAGFDDERPAPRRAPPVDDFPGDRDPISSGRAPARNDDLNDDINF